MSDGFGDIPVDDDLKPSVLGASATVEATKDHKKKRQKVKRSGSGTSTGADGYVEYVYEPHVAVLPPLRQYFSDLWSRRAFLIELARSEIRGKRSNTTLGSLWALLDPLFMAAIYFFLFSVIRRGGGRSTDFVPLILAGILLFQIVGGALTEGAGSVRRGRTLMLNSTFPRALLPLSTIYQLVLNFLPGIPIIFLALFMFNDWDIAGALSWQQLWLIPAFVVIVVSSVGAALLVSTLVVFVSDATNVMSYLSRVMLFATPIIYPYTLLEDAGVLHIVRWQPFFGSFVAVQNALQGLRPDFGMLLTSVAWAVGMVIAGFWVFLRYERQFSSRI